MTTPSKWSWREYTYIVWFLSVQIISKPLLYYAFAMEDNFHKYCLSPKNMVWPWHKVIHLFSDYILLKALEYHNLLITYDPRLWCNHKDLRPSIRLLVGKMCNFGIRMLSFVSLLSLHLFLILSAPDLKSKESVSAYM